MKYGPLKIFMSALVAAAISFSAHAAEVALVLSEQDEDSSAISSAFSSEYPGEAKVINLEGSDDRQRTVGQELAASPPSAVIVCGNMAAQMAEWHLAEVPVAFCDSPKALKLKVSGRAPGVYHEPSPSEQLRALNKALPDDRKVAMLYGDGVARVDPDEIKGLGAELGITVVPVPIGSVKEVPAKLASVLPSVDALWILTDPEVLSSHSTQYIVLQSISSRVPVFCGDETLARGGATAALVPDMESVGELLAGQAEKAVSGGGASVVFPRGRIIINTKTAAIVGVTFPTDVVSKASEVIQ